MSTDDRGPHEPKEYVILTASEAESINYSEVFITSAETLQWSIDKSQTYVKYLKGSKPGFLQGKASLTYSEILIELSSPDWIIDE